MFAGSRVKSLLEGSSGTVAVGGKTDEETNYISPTLLVDVQLSDSVMKDEVRAAVLLSVIVAPVYCEVQ